MLTLGKCYNSIPTIEALTDEAPMHTELHNTDTASLIDELGNLQAAIKELEEREKKLSTEIKARLDDKVEIKGTKFVASKKTNPQSSTPPKNFNHQKNKTPKITTTQKNI